MRRTSSKVIKTSLLIVLSIAAFFSCKKEITGEFQNPPDPKIDWAKSYYRHSLEPTVGLVNKPGAIMSADGKVGVKKTNKLTANWDKAIAEETSLYDYVETPLSYEHKISTTLGLVSDPSKAPAANKDVINASFDRLVIFKNKSGEINQRIISYIPDESYLKKKNGKIDHNRVGHLDKDFFGFLQYKSWDDKLLFVLRIENGRPVKRYRMESKGVEQLKSFAPSNGKLSYTPGKTMVRPPGEGGGGDPPMCTYVISWEWYQDCYYYANSNIPYACDEPVVYNVRYTQIGCDDSGGGFGGGGGVTDPVDPECLDDQVFIDGKCVTVENEQEIKLDSLYKYYPCMVKLILNKLSQNKAYNDLMAPFKNPNYPALKLPNLEFDFAAQDYGGTTTNYMLGATQTSFWNATIKFNTAAMTNASQLFLQTAAIHEAGHAYANYYLIMGANGYPVVPPIDEAGKVDSTWAMRITNFAAMQRAETLGPNYVDHSLFLENYFDTIVSILAAINGSAYTMAEYRMAALYGLNNPGTPPSGLVVDTDRLNTYNLLKARITKTYDAIKTKYGLNDATIANFNRDNLINVPAAKKLPSNCP